MSYESLILLWAHRGSGGVNILQTGEKEKPQVYCVFALAESGPEVASADQASALLRAPRFGPMIPSSNDESLIHHLEHPLVAARATAGAEVIP
jgi:hypothetical protein